MFNPRLDRECYTRYQLYIPTMQFYTREKGETAQYQQLPDRIPDDAPTDGPKTF